ncbi:3-isopropylmalate dehydratase small subunit [Synechococcus sp. CBW1002]|uniref:3-isopropylmalate dehydratase small subunit n=1 Tax=Synechococcus sp. CBW1002 TaxID=1353134 RepID=UPI0018CD6B87|nr:3-isopropylmalate dehydratase small subunit [Synechococcus sp. CBW1002]QPN61137.1 3-isopropylmalate dehydratase small subunit [Synechococcus sp. CBW1002]
MTSISAPFPFGAIASVVGTAVAVRGDDIDTDRIIPARFLKCVTFEGLGEQAFADDRAELKGAHPFDRPEHQGATVLVVNRNFGCGSSREHAPQSLMRWGIRAVIGESFAEIFYGNCLALGIPCLSVSHADALALQAAIEADPAASVVVDLDTLRVSLNAAADSAAVISEGASWPLTLADGPRRMLLSGQWDATSQLLAHDDQLRATAARLPYLTSFSAA